MDISRKNISIWGYICFDITCDIFPELYPKRYISNQKRYIQKWIYFKSRYIQKVIYTKTDISKKEYIHKRIYPKIILASVACVLYFTTSFFFSRQTLQGATSASFCRNLDRDTALESSNVEL